MLGDPVQMRSSVAGSVQKGIDFSSQDQASLSSIKTWTETRQQADGHYLSSCAITRSSLVSRLCLESGPSSHNVGAWMRQRSNVGYGKRGLKTRECKCTYCQRKNAVGSKISLKHDWMGLCPCVVSMQTDFET